MNDVSLVALPLFQMCSLGGESYDAESTTGVKCLASDATGSYSINYSSMGGPRERSLQTEPSTSTVQNSLISNDSGTTPRK